MSQGKDMTNRSHSRGVKHGAMQWNGPWPTTYVSQWEKGAGVESDTGCYTMEGTVRLRRKSGGKQVKQGYHI